MSRKEQIEAVTEIIDLYDAGFEKRIIKAGVKQFTLTQEQIDAVLRLDLGRYKFKSPQKVRAICKMRTTGANYTEIGKKYGLSSNRVREIVRRVEHLYRIYIENGSTS